MGCNPLNKNCSTFPSMPNSISEVVAPAPNPKDFNIIRHLIVEDIVIMEIGYPDCNTFEGKKICVYRSQRKWELFDAKELDPHFTEEIHSPIARFPANDIGWKNAYRFAQIVHGKQDRKIIEDRYREINTHTMTLEQLRKGLKLAKASNVPCPNIFAGTKDKRSLHMSVDTIENAMKFAGEKGIGVDKSVILRYDSDGCFSWVMVKATAEDEEVDITPIGGY
jgi:hypothetical protein